MAILWTYAAMTGFSAPVMRSVWMFSVMLFAQVFRMNSHPVNSWAFSGFVLLVIQPLDFFQVGFQLSYAAVLGLILFQARLVSLVKPKYWLVSQVWELTCVAISAQILTWPLIIYYFHQFPNPIYFFLLNPILILLSSITLGIGFLYLILAPIFSFIPFLIPGLGQLLLLSFELLHGVMFSTTNQFQTVISFIRLNEFEVGCYYVGLVLLWFWWTSRRIYGLYLCLLVMTGILINRFIEPLNDHAYLTLAEKKLVYIRGQGMHGQVLGDPTSIWLQSNVSGWLSRSQVVDTLTQAWPNGSFTWLDQGKEFVYLMRPGIQIIRHPAHLILAADLDLRDPRFLQAWQNSTWYFVRKPSAYRLGKIKPYLPEKVYYLSEQPAVYFP
jgi:ComEC/Rec2-related protein